MSRSSRSAPLPTRSTPSRFDSKGENEKPAPDGNVGNGIWWLAGVAFVIAAVAVGFAIAAFAKENEGDTVGGNLEVDGNATFYGDVVLPPTSSSNRGGGTLTLGKIEQLSSNTPLTPLSVVMVDDTGMRLQAVSPEMGWLIKQDPVLWVSDGGNDANSGLSNTTPMRSVQSALTLLADPSVAWTGEARVVIIGATYTPTFATWSADIGPSRSVVIQGGEDFTVLGSMNTNAPASSLDGSRAIGLPFAAGSLATATLGSFVRVSGKVYPVSPDIADNVLVLPDALLSDEFFANPFPSGTTVEFLEPSCKVQLPAASNYPIAPLPGLAIFNLQSTGTIETQMLTLVPNFQATWLVAGSLSDTEGSTGTVRFGPGTEVFAGIWENSGAPTDTHLGKILTLCSTEFNWMTITGSGIENYGPSIGSDSGVGSPHITQDPLISMASCALVRATWTLGESSAFQSCIFGAPGVSGDIQSATEFSLRPGANATFNLCTFVLGIGGEASIYASGAHVLMTNCNLRTTDALFLLRSGATVQMYGSHWTSPVAGIAGKASLATLDTQSTFVSIGELAGSANGNSVLYLSMNHGSQVNLTDSRFADGALYALDGVAASAIGAAVSTGEQVGANSSVFTFKQSNL
jgi:hypothetical protein